MRVLFDGPSESLTLLQAIERDPELRDAHENARLLAFSKPDSDEHLAAKERFQALRAKAGVEWKSYRRVTIDRGGR